MSQYADFDLDRSTARAWSAFQLRLADHLTEMAEGEMLFFDVVSGLGEEETGVAPYLQYSAWGDDLVRCEVSSNEFLASAYRLTAAGAGRLQELGWSAPSDGSFGDPDGGSPNFYIDTERSQGDRLAVMTVKALREVFGVAHPVFLTVRGGGGAPEHPDLGIPAAFHEPDPVADEPLATEPEGSTHLRELVDLALMPVFGHLPSHDADGDIPVATGSALVFVRVHEDTPVLEIFGTLVQDIEYLDVAVEAVAELNRDFTMVKFVLVDDAVMAVIHLPAMPFAPQQLRSTLTYMAELADNIDDRLAERLGGRRASEVDPLAEPPSEVEPEEDEESEDLAPELLALVDLDPDGTGGVDPDLAASVCNYDRDLVLRFLRKASEQEIEWCRSRDEATMKDDRIEAEACAHEARGWASTVETLRDALRVIVERNRIGG